MLTAQCGRGTKRRDWRWDYIRTSGCQWCPLEQSGSVSWILERALENRAPVLLSFEFPPGTLRQ